ncbi:MAG: right-handed parallel beta-helix repeat-containing protein, partial [Anaerolineales bacterium]
MNSKGRGLRAIILTGALALGLALASLALWGASAAPQTGTAASIYCVNGTGTACDASLDGCFATIQPAIDAASSGDQLLIAGGIYTEPGGTVVAIGGKGLNIDGGYNPSCSQHDPDQYQTVLDGQALGTVVSVTNTGADLFMRWLTIQNGDGRGNCGIGGCGGGIYVLNSDFRLGHSIVRQNTGASPPSVVGDGGGIYIYNFYQPGHFVHIFDNQILSNTCSNLPSPGAQVGGGLNIYGSEILLNDNLFQGNLCIGHGDAGGAYLYDFATADLQNNQFLDNRAQRAAGGLMTLGGVISLSHNTFQNNHAGTPSSSGSGSAMWMVIPQGTADGNTFLNNTGGDAVRIRTSHGLTLTNNLIAANDAGLIIVGVDPADLTLLANNTIADNGGSLGISLYYTATAELVNNI